MKTLNRLIPKWPIVLVAASLAGSAKAAVLLPASAALPTNSVSNPGFVVRTAQASTNFTVANNFNRALRQINGLLTDTTGAAITNIAIPGTNPLGAYHTDWVDFEKDGAFVDVRDADGVINFGWFSELFPGIPGEEGETTQFATEVVALVPLTAGTHMLAISSAADRTDVNDDDGYAVFVGANPRDFFATKIAEFQRAGAASFTGNQHVENLIEVTAPVTGAYPFRILHWQQTRGSSLHFYKVNTNTSLRVLINDPSDPSTPRAYRSSTNASFNSPYVADISPVPNSAGNSSAAPIVIVLLDGTTSTVNTNSIQLSLNGSTVTATVSKTGNKTTITHNPNPGRTDINNDLRLVFSDSSGAVHIKTWAFTIITAGGSATTVTGQWDFDFGDLRATFGTPLQFFDPTYDGPAGTNPNKTSFGTTTSFGIPDINGQVANVMFVPGDTGPGSRRLGYLMTHGIAPNGGGTRVNQYTIIFDIMCTNNSGAASLIQISDPTSNTDDGDLFWQGGDFGQGGGGYNGTGALTPNVWHRIVAAYDEAANPPVVTKYVDGIKQDDWTASQGLDNPRRALLPTAILFGDGDQDERRNFWVNSIQIRSGKLSDAEMVALGTPDARGIPATVPQSTVTGQWDFDRGNLAATVGKPLQYFNPTYDNGGALPTPGTNANQTAFGTCSSFGIPLINGVDANIIQVPGDTGPGSRNLGYVMTHGIAPNGGGTRVNQYTIIYDIMCTNNSGAASLIQISDPTSNTDDGDLFWQGGDFGQGGGGYNGTGALTPNVWHRIVAAYDEAANPPVVTKYVDGIKQDDWTANQGLDNARRALSPTAVLFGDGDQDERRTFWVNSIQIRAGKMSDADIVQLGVPTGTGIPVVIPRSTVAGQWDFDRGNLAATVGKPLQYFNPTYDNGGALPTPGTNVNQTAFGTCSSFGVPLINGVDAKVIQVPGDTGPGSRNLGYVMTHGIAPNGGGTRVNQYTIIFDILCANNSGAASLIQISDPTSNADDGDLFWQGANFGQGGGGYNGTGALTPNEWHRIAAAYNEAATPPVVTKYVDGVFQDDWTANQGLDNARRALSPTAVLFGDGDQDERRTFWVNSIQIRDGALSKAELAALGAPTTDGIPVRIPVEVPPSLTFGKIGNGLTLIWPLSATGYTLKSSPNLSSPVWTAVPGVVNNSVVVAVGSGNAFFRLEK